MSTQDNKDVARRFIELLDEKRVDEAFQLIADDAVIHTGAGWGAQDKKTMRAIEEMFSAAFPDLKHHLASDSIVAEGDFVAVRCLWSGTHRGDLKDLPATGKSVMVPFMAMWRIVNGRIVEHWHLTDVPHLQSQLGSSAPKESGR